VYRIVVADSQSPRDGKFIEIIGQYAPRQAQGGLNVNEERANYWLGVGHEQRLGIELKAAAIPLPERSAEEEAALQGETAAETTEV
jgi:small subunit ribosomal protein S16